MSEEQLTFHGVFPRKPEGRMTQAYTTSHGLLAPLHSSSFRWAWLAGLVTNTGTFMQAVAAAWLMTTLTSSVYMVAMVQVASMAPLFLLGPLAGSAADLFDRRRLLVVMQIVMFFAAAGLGLADKAGFATPSLLLALSAILAAGSALTMPSWDSLMLELADPAMLRQSVTLNGISMNVARAVGPALAGVIIAQAGIPPVFFINAISFVGVAAVAFALKSASDRPQLVGERLFSNVRIGFSFVRHSPVLHPVLARAFAYACAASCLSALLPTYIKTQLNAGPQALGLLFAFFGVGAVAGAYPMHRLRDRTDLSVGSATICGAIGLAVIAHTHSLPLAAIGCTVVGASWLIVLATAYSALQAGSPLWMRGRIVSLNMIMLSGSVALGSLIWGTIASYVSVPFAFSAAAAVLFGTLFLHSMKFSPALGRNVQPVLFWGAPAIAEDYVARQNDRTPVNVIVEYRVVPENQFEFQRQMQLMRRSRLRSGATRWELCRDSEKLDTFIESFVAENWAQHLRHHEQTLEEDRLIEQQLHSLLSENPRVRHWTIEQF
jgi:MFS family permease